MTTDNAAENVAAAAAEAPKPKQPSQNGVTMPKEGTQTGKVWSVASSMSAELGRPVLSDELQNALAGDVAKPTIATQYNRWCKFYGVSKADRSAVRAAIKAEAEAAAAAETAETAETAEAAEAE